MVVAVAVLLARSTAGTISVGMAALLVVEP